MRKQHKIDQFAPGTPHKYLGFNPAGSPTEKDGGAGVGGSDKSIQYNNAGGAAGVGEVKFSPGVTQAGSLGIRGSHRGIGYLSDTNTQKSDYYADDLDTVVAPAALSYVHYCRAIDDAPVNTILWVEATVVAQQESALNGGVIKVGALFKKDNGGVVTKIGADVALMTAVEDIGTGTIAAAFSVGGGRVSCTHTTSVNCFTAVTFRCTVCGNT